MSEYGKSGTVDMFVFRVFTIVFTFVDVMQSKPLGRLSLPAVRVLFHL